MESNIDIESLFVNKEIAIKLKELGFNQPCFARYFRGKFQLNFLGKPYDHNSGEIDKRYVSAPLIHQAVIWYTERFGPNYAFVFTNPDILNKRILEELKNVSK